MELSEVTSTRRHGLANMQKLYRQAYDMGLVDMTSSGSCIVLENSLGACSRLSTGKPATPRHSHALLIPVFYLTTVRSQSSRPFTLVCSQFFCGVQQFNFS